MEMKTISRRILTIFLLICLCFVLQTALFSRFELAGVTPNLLLILVASFGFMRGRREGMIVGLFCGLVVDMYMGTYVGLYALFYLYLGFFNGLFRKIFYGDDFKLPLILIGVSDLIYGLMQFCYLFLMNQEADFGFYFWNVMIPEAVYTVLIAIFLYYLILKVNQWLEKTEKRSSGRFVR